jgi:hypothetical protein
MEAEKECVFLLKISKGAFEIIFRKIKRISGRKEEKIKKKREKKSL